MFREKLEKANRVSFGQSPRKWANTQGCLTELEEIFPITKIMISKEEIRSNFKELTEQVIEFLNGKGICRTCGGIHKNVRGWKWAIHAEPEVTYEKSSLD